MFAPWPICCGNVVFTKIFKDFEAFFVYAKNLQNSGYSTICRMYFLLVASDILADKVEIT
jgi:hypothetical protein